MRWLVTGGCGFIGRSLINRLLADPQNEIRVLDNYTAARPTDVEALAGGGITRLNFVEGDIRDEEMVFRAAESRDIIVH